MPLYDEKLGCGSQECHAGLHLIEVKDLWRAGPLGPRGLITSFIITHFRKMSTLPKPSHISLSVQGVARVEIRSCSYAPLNVKRQIAFKNAVSKQF